MGAKRRTGSGIYAIVNKATGKCYIGRAIDILDRWRHHRWELRAGRHKNPHLQHAWTRYGEAQFVFSVIEYAERSALPQLEQRYLDATTAKSDYFYNNQTFAGDEMLVSPETRERMSVAATRRGRTLPIGFRQSAEARQKMSRAKKGRRINPATEFKKGLIPWNKGHRSVKADLVGKRCGMLLVVGRENRRWKCQCDCGNVRLLRTGHLNAGYFFSCGCTRRHALVA